MNKWKKRIYENKLLFVGIVVILILGVFFFFPHRKKPLCANCNVVFIDIDVLRADGLECFGYLKSVAPNLCRFAQSGVRFRHNITQSYWTMPSMFSTVTSLYVSAHKVRYALINKLSPGVLTIAEILKSRGYTTTFVSSMLPTEAWFLNEENGGLRGYDRIEHARGIELWLPTVKELDKTGKPFFFHLYAQDPHMPYLLPDGVQPKEDIAQPKGLPITQKEFDEALEDYLVSHYQGVFTDLAIQERPSLFTNISASKKTLREYYETLSRAYDLSRLKVTYAAIENTYMQFIDGTKQEDRAYLRMLYDMKISLMDKKLGQFLDYLSSSRVKDNTIIIIMSDHGEAFGERGSFLHDDSQYNETIHTPLIIRVPGIEGKDISSVTQNIDILPTVIDVLGGKIIRQFQGVSLLPYINGKQTKVRVAVSEADTKISLQDDRWKLIADKSGNPETFELYNLISDPLETSNSAGGDQKSANVYYERLRLILDQADRQFENLLPLFIDTEKRKKVMKEGYF